MGRKRGVQYRPGSFYRQDDRSGFATRAENTRQEWNNLIVDKKLWEPRQPQDFVQGVYDDQSVPQPRPTPPAQFVGPLSTQLSLPALTGATFLHLEAINGFGPGVQVGIVLDGDGDIFRTTQVGASVPTGITIASPLPYTAARGNNVTVYVPNPGVFP